MAPLIIYVEYTTTVFFICTLITALPSVFQERKIWKVRGVPDLTLWGLFKVYWFNVFWMNLTMLGSIWICFYAILLRQTSRQALSNKVEGAIGKLLLQIFIGPVKVVGREHIPKDPDAKPAPVYIANHASQLDVAVVYQIDRRFKWIAKKSVTFVPGVGQLLRLGDHVFIDRGRGSTKNKASIGNLYAQSNASIQAGIPMFFFPQGTRRMVERLPFKDGAFKVAAESLSDVVPISCQHSLWAWNSAYPFKRKPDNDPAIVLTIHKPIKSKDFARKGSEKDVDLEALKSKCFEVIYSGLPDYRKEN